ncbi:DNA primase [Streptococcus sp. DD12]|uniref:DNA primase n=1 Tax=Streptococcus sp. DD12 TaxID=1777880 RepID=UPI000796C331|nr:DNA primase [Streptococcus sp. DD12]KXT76646.1 DNA primase [Streptococcus sp. DD12]
MGELSGGEAVAIDKRQIEDIKERLNIVDVIGEVVRLSKTGHNYVGLCPFHQEKTPSFHVIEDKQFYHCFGCGKSGDVYRFIEDYRQVSFAESVAILADKAGVVLDQRDVAYAKPKQSPHQALYDIHEDARHFYQTVLQTTKIGEKAREYLYARGLDDAVIAHFGIGLAPDEPDFFYRSLKGKYDESIVLDSGLFSVTDTNQFLDSFRNRIMFPLTDDQGRVVAFSGRVWQDVELPQGGKYKNSRSTKIFNKSLELYHLDQAKVAIKQAHEVYIMEGFMDVIAAFRAGISNVVASMGTALTPEQVQHLGRYTKNVILAYDGDRAGQAAIAKALSLVPVATTRVVVFPTGLDPDEYLQKYAAEDFVRHLNDNRLSATEFWMTHLKPENPDNLQQEIAYVDRMAQLIVQEPSITAQNTYIMKLAEGLPDFTYQQVEDTVNQLRLQRANQAQSTDAIQRPVAPPVVLDLPQHRQQTALETVENQLLNRLLDSDVLLNDYRLKEAFQFYTPERQRLYELLCQEGSIDRGRLAQESDRVQTVYYQVLEEPLPKDLGPGEMQALEKRQAACLMQKDFKKQGQRVREMTKQGDTDGALAALADLIAQKRKME